MAINRKILIATIAIGGLLLSGCSALTYLDGSSDDELTAFCSGKPVVKRNALGETPEEERRRIEIENRADKRVQDELAKRSQIEGEREREKAALFMQIGALKQDVKTLEEQLAAIEEEKARMAAAKQPVTVAMTMPSTPLKIKVLSGNGRMISAKNMASRIKTLGYDVERVDLAPSTAFPVDIVFFNRDFADQAKALAGRLGPGTITKPLTWKSVFSMIVVTRNEKLD